MPDLTCSSLLYWVDLEFNLANSLQVHMNWQLFFFLYHSLLVYNYWDLERLACSKPSFLSYWLAFAQSFSYKENFIHLQPQVMWHLIWSCTCSHHHKYYILKCHFGYIYICTSWSEFNHIFVQLRPNYANIITFFLALILFV